MLAAPLIIAEIVDAVVDGSDDDSGVPRARTAETLLSGAKAVACALLFVSSCGIQSRCERALGLMRAESSADDLGMQSSATVAVPRFGSFPAGRVITTGATRRIGATESRGCVSQHLTAITMSSSDCLLRIIY